MKAIDDAPLLARHRFTVADYLRMVEIGVLTSKSRVELIDGFVIDMEPKSARHASACMRLLGLLTRATVDRGVPSAHHPLRLSDWSEPEPDLMLLKPRADFYAAAHPAAADVLLLIEVADTSARYDREVKLPLYARHGVAEVWIVDLEARQVRFFRAPVGDKYTDITAIETPSATPVTALPGVAIDLAGLLG